MVKTEGWRDNDSLMNGGFDYHFRVRHSQGQFM